MRLLSVVLFVVATAAASWAGWWGFNRPIPVELSYDEPFPSVSFAPYRRGYSPLTKSYPPPELIEEDLKSLVGVTKGIRTYTAREGLEILPGLARKYGIEVTHSAWLGREADINDREVEALIRAANQYPDSITRVIVGNEVLLRQDQTAPQIAAYLRKVRAAVKQPVSYADVWAFWLKHPELANEVDFVTVHILPYWEDEPVSVDEAAAHIVKIYRMIGDAFPGKPILIGEAGWPTRGRNRGPAAANMENGARFVRTLAKISKDNGFDYNVVEAFDQPWKAKLEGTVGANWGVVDSQRQVKFRMAGPVEANPNWPIHAAASMALGVAGGLVFLRRPQRYRPTAALALAALAQGLAALVTWQALNAWWLGYDWLGDTWAVIRIAVHAGLAAAILAVAGKGLADGGGPEANRWGERLMTLFGAAAVLSTAILLINGRYRDIPNLEFLVPCVGITAFAAVRMVFFRLGWEKAFAVGRLFSGGRGGGFAPARQMTLGLLAAAVAAPLSEAVALARGDDFITMHPALSDQLPLLAGIMWANPEMLVWSAMLVVMALPYWAEWRCQRRIA
ncbi:MAG: exo-beta-1,3-glucanase [Magnetospirillum sp.]|nr:exo-beta-1,3-glucanase [Magnetospirillum sp.]